MSLNPEIRDQAYQFFVEEAQELLQVLESGLLDLQEDHSIPKVHELMRAAHSIKGGAASVELQSIELLAHRLEDFFKALYSDEVDFDAELEGLLLQGYDCLSHPLLEQITAGSFDEEAALLKAEPVFTALEIRLSEALKNADNYLPSSNDLGVDIVSSIFEVDVAQALNHLQTVSLNPDHYDLPTELTGTLEMFAGFAELFNLSGFGEIVQTAQSALGLNPQQALEIIKLTIADCGLGTAEVLAGDRLQGGTVSLALRELAQSNLGQSATVAQEPITDLDEIFAFPEISSDNSFEQLLQMGSEQSEPEVQTGNEGFSWDEIPVEADSLWSDSNNLDFSEADIFDPNTEELATENEPTSESTDDAFNRLWEIAVEPTVPEPITEESFTWGDIPNDGEEIWSDLNVFQSTNTETAEALNFEVNSESIVEELEITNNTTVNHSEQTEITAAIESISEIFDSLPPAQVEQLLPLVETPTNLVTPAAKPESETLGVEYAASQAAFPPTKLTKNTTKNTPAKLSVRVDLDRLERMNNLVGELTINRNSLALQNEQLQENVGELEAKFWRFREVTKQLRSISDQMLLEARISSPPPGRSPNSITTTPKTKTSYEAIAEFDTLELDSYSLLHSSLQEVLEEIMQLEESVEDISLFAQQSDRTINSQRQMLGQIRDELMWVRMLPLEQILQRFPRILRDLGHKYHKPVELELTGTGVLVDKAILEKLADPLLHLLRNGFDHGIENPEIRTQQGKSGTGLITIQAYYQGNQTVIEVKDDGRGLDLAKITQKGLELGLISAQEAASADPERLFELIFEPGFSTASQVSEISGRGVGMNIVRSQVETLKGKISVTSDPGKGSTFTLRLPLTLTIAKLLVCSLGSTALAIPSDSIEEIVIPTREQIKIGNGQKFLFFKGKLIPIFVLPEILTYNCPIPDPDANSKAFKTIAPPEDWGAPLLLLRRGQKLFALEVERLLSEQELVIKPYGKAIAPPSYSYGCTILSDGSLIPAIDGSALIGIILGEEVAITGREEDFSEVEQVIEVGEAVETDQAEAEEISLRENLEQVQEGVISKVPAAKTLALKTIMIVDDSTALRRTMALTLEKEGYRVVQKKDGKEALDGFKQNPEIDLIICDVEMPVMNGFEFLGMRRRDSALAKVPTFMLTSRSGAKHRNLAQQLGADGYFTKPYVEQEFVQEIKKILGSNKKDSLKQMQTAIAIKTKTILVIDDSSALRRTLALSLEQRGYRVLQSRDGGEGLEQLRSNLQTDLVICDIEMPNVNGFEFLTLRRQEPELTKVPVVMLTSRSTEKHRNLAASLGAVGFFTKPYVEETFITEIEQYIH